MPVKRTAPTAVVVTNKAGVKYYRKRPYKPSKVIRCLPTDVYCFERTVRGMDWNILPTTTKEGWFHVPLDLVAVAVITLPPFFYNSLIRYYFIIKGGNIQRVLTAEEDQIPHILNPSNILVGYSPEGIPLSSFITGIEYGQTPEMCATEFFSAWTVTLDQLGFSGRSFL